MGQERVEGYAEGFRIGWDKGVKKFIKLLKKEYPCCMKKRKCLEHHNIICSGCKIGYKMDKTNDEFCVEDVA